jgi:hypothetical protein
VTAALNQRSKDEIQRALRHEFRCPDSSRALQRALAAEHIRAAVYTATAYGTSGHFQRVHTGRLMANLRRNLEGFWAPEENADAIRAEVGNEDPYRSVLNDLNVIGDVFDTGGGFWIAAPLRLVETSDLEVLLVFGGSPKEVVEATFGTQVECAATARFIRRAHLQSTATALDAVQSLDEWLGHSEPLRSWTNRAISFYHQQLSRAEGTSADALEIYAPDLFRDSRKLGRWMSASEVHQALPELRLCRPRASHARLYDRPYYLGLFDYQHGALALRRSAQVDYETSRRLRFGLDELFNTPRTATLSVGADICLVDLRYTLPEPECRVLALGWAAPSVGAAAPLAFHRAVMPALLKAFQRLSINPAIIPRSP